MSNDERGALIREFPQQASGVDGKFMLFLAFLGCVLAIPAYLMGNMLIAALLIGGALAVPIPFVVIAKLTQSTKTALLGIYEHGLLARVAGQPQFLPWAEFTQLRSWTNDTEGPGEITESRYRFFELTSRGGVHVVLGPLQGGEETLQLVEARTRLVPEDLGFKRWR